MWVTGVTLTFMFFYVPQITFYLFIQERLTEVIDQLEPDEVEEDYFR